MSKDVAIRPASWDQDQDLIRAVRIGVFVKEQNIPEELEMDGLDADCHHVIALDHQSAPIGVARMQSDGHIGRIAVLPQWRRQGIATQLVKALLAKAADLGLGRVYLNAQTHALHFYEKLGFALRGEVFLEAGIPHRNMILNLPKS